LYNPLTSNIYSSVINRNCAHTTSILFLVLTFLNQSDLASNAAEHAHQGLFSDNRLSWSPLWHLAVYICKTIPLLFPLRFCPLYREIFAARQKLGEFKFFLLQAVAITIEYSFLWLWKTMGWKGGVRGRVLGYVWFYFLYDLDGQRTGGW
jgi:hypothetical protein